MRTWDLLVFIYFLFQFNASDHSATAAPIKNDNNESVGEPATWLPRFLMPDAGLVDRVANS